MSEIGNRIRSQRLHLGLQQEELAEQVRRYTDGRAVAVETLSRIETGRNEPAAWMIRALAEAMDITSDYLLGLADDPGPPGVPRFPVPTPEIARLVVRLNDLPVALRSKLAGSIMQIVEAANPAPDEDAELAQLYRIWRDLAPERRNRLVAGMLAEIAEADRAKTTAAKTAAAQEAAA